MKNKTPLKPSESIRRHLVAGAVAALLLIGGVGGWAVTTELSGAVIAQGILVVDSNVKKVQHPTGGVVGEVRVRDGDHVKAGDIVVRLDETQMRANLAIVTKGLDEFAARQARDEAERDDVDTVDFPKGLLDRGGDPDVAHAVNGERRLFEIRRKAREGLKGQLKERIVQLNEEINGLGTQQKARVDQIEWIMKELEGVRDLWNKTLVPYTRLTSLEREASRIEGERGQFTAQIAQTKGKISETELQIIQVDQDMRAEVGKDLAEIRGKTSELVEKKVAAEDQLKRVDIRAPQDGVVMQSTVHTVGGVIMQGDPIMLVVPETDLLTVEAKIAPQDIDQVHFGQTAALRFSAFNQRTTPELTGTVVRISADVAQDQKTGGYYYTVRVSVSENEFARLNGLKLIPGMPVEVFVQTKERKAISYLVRPISDQIVRAFREK
jgi:membrane fusion protein, type I secretion system